LNRLPDPLEVAGTVTSPASSDGVPDIIDAGWNERRPRLVATERLRLFCVVDQKSSLIFHTLIVVGSTTVAGLVLAVADVARIPVAIWLAVVLLTDVSIFLLNSYLRRSRLGESELPRWARIKAALTVFNGVMLSSGAIVLHAPGAIISVLAPAWAIMLAVASTIFASAPYAPCMYGMMFACTMPAAVFLLLQGAELEMAVGTSMIMFLPAAFGIGTLALRNNAATVGTRLDVANLLERQTHLVKRLKEVSAERTRFFSAASHDLRQPLQACDFYMSLLESTADEHTRRDLIARLAQCVDSLDRQFNAILGVTEIDAVIERTTATPLPLQVVFDRVVASIKPEADLKQLRVRCVATSRWVLAPTDALERVLVNLLINAVRYTPEGSVLIGARPKAGRVEIWVADTGIGIEPQHHARIFEDFFQIDNPERNRRKGFGLGLAIVHRLSEGMQWPLTLRSRPGKGSIFAVSLPQAQPGNSLSLNAQTFDTAGMQRLAVLLVDDDELVRNATERLLVSWNVTVKACSTSDEAIHILQQRDTTRRWRALIDYRLVADNGILLAERIRRAGGDDVVIFLMTAETDERILAAARSQGLRVLRKPLKPINLRAALM
jgi:signal transduction histidine kinase